MEYRARRPGLAHDIVARKNLRLKAALLLVQLTLVMVLFGNVFAPHPITPAVQTLYYVKNWGEWSVSIILTVATVLNYRDLRRLYRMQERGRIPPHSPPVPTLPVIKPPGDGTKP